MNKKNGISMFVLILTVIIVIILLSAVSLNLSDVSSINKIGIFATNLNTIQEYISSCNMLKEELPFNGEISLEEIKSKMTDEYYAYFMIELEEKGDKTTVNFKKVDLTAIGTLETATGFEENGETDIYVYSEITDTVYYLKGLKHKGEIYFCINNKITNIIE